MLTRVPQKKKKKAEATGELIGTRTEKIVKLKPVPKAKPRYVEELHISPEQKQEIKNDLRLL